MKRFPAIISKFSGILFLAYPVLLHFQPDFSNSTVFPQRLPGDEKISQQSALNGLGLQQAWDTTTGSPQVTIAIIDDAIDINHPDLKDNMLSGWDFVDGDSDPSPGACYDPATQTPIVEDHGTSVAGVIGAVGDNYLGIAGINWQVSILPIRVGCAYSPTYESQAVAYAISQGAHIINASYAGPEFLIRNADVIRQLNDTREQVLFITSAGNYHTSNDITPMYPGNAGLINMITVASSNTSNQLSHWSQFGASSVDLAAPGEQLLSTAYESGGGTYENVSGTSFSTAVISGIAGLIKAVDLHDGINDLAPGDIKGIIQSSGSKLNNQKGLLKTDSIAHAANALATMNLKRPVISLTSIKVNDSSSGEGKANGIIDPEEIFTLDLELENLWDDAYGLQFELTSDNTHIIPIENMALVSTWVRNSKNAVSFRLQSDAYTAFQRFPFKLKISANGTERNTNIVREFELTSGPLSNNITVSDTIQQSATDEIRQWQLLIPAEANKVAIEIERLQTDARKLGVLANIGTQPQVFFKESGANEYSAESSFKMYSNELFERLDFNVVSQKPETINILVFNKATSHIDESVLSNKKYRIKACYFTSNNSNKPPKVNAGLNLTVNPGDSVVLSGTMSDDDGEITKSWWSSDTGIVFSSEPGNKISFIAPQSGTHTFVLTAIDDGCNKSADSVTVTIKDQNDGTSGLQINPKNIEIEEGSVISVQVSANFGGVPVSDLRLISGPDGLQFIKSTSRDSFDQLIWQDTAVAGTYIVLFDSQQNGAKVLGRIIIDIKPRGGNSGGGGGCTTGKSDAFDPIFLFYLSFSSFILLKRRLYSTKN